jgi:hypothetical protein
MPRLSVDLDLVFPDYLVPRAAALFASTRHDHTGGQATANLESRHGSANLALRSRHTGGLMRSAPVDGPTNFVVDFEHPPRE